MTAIPDVPKDTSVEQLLLEIMPKVAAEILKEGNAAEELAGTEITMVVEMDGKPYSYRVKDGRELDFTMGDTENAMLRLKLSGEDMEKMIQTGNLDMILGMQNDLNKAEYNTLSTLKGKFIAEIDNEDGSVFRIEAILNSSQEPNSVFKMNSENTSALMRRETNPVNLFMSGAVKIEGDMSFAMATQPLFT